MREKPRAVLGVGGYVSVPICVAAYTLRIPVYLQEQNASVGIANRFLGKLAKRVFLGFEQAKVSFAAQKVIVTGNPIRKEFTRSDFPEYQPNSNTLFVFGGSQGAIAVNNVIIDCLSELYLNYPGLRIIHQTGEKECPRVKQAYAEKFQGPYEILPFINDMASIYAKASLVISRSGALTVSELIQVGRPAILIPFPRTGQNDQTDNARFLEQKGVGRMIEQGERFKERFWQVLVETFDPERLKLLAGNFSSLRGGSALVTIGDQIERDLN